MKPAGDAGWLIRNRNWVLAAVLVVAVMGATVAAGRHGGGGPGASVRVGFGARVRPPRTVRQLLYTNGWVAASGRQSIGVYAGGQAGNRQNGLLVVVRVNGGRQRIAQLVVHGSGAVTLLRPPAPASESDALGATLRFITANGATGTLELSSDRVGLSG